MSAYAEYKYAKTEQEREEAWKGIMEECRQEMIADLEAWEEESKNDYALPIL